MPAGGKALLLCRSGVRSVAAARRATELGIEAYNILEGFEGDADGDGAPRPQGRLALARPALEAELRSYFSGGMRSFWPG